jgi:uncharacterized protein
MAFEMDEAKRQGNLDKHGVDFLRAIQLFDGRPVLTAPSSYPDETRFITTGMIDERFYTAVWTQRGENIRLISARRARDAEARANRAVHGGAN